MSDKNMINWEAVFRARIKYWETRCRLAEKYINESPCDPDITQSQIEAYNEWQEFLKDAPKYMHQKHIKELHD